MKGKFIKMRVKKPFILVFVLWFVCLPFLADIVLNFDKDSKVILKDISSGQTLSIDKLDFIIGSIASEMPASYSHDALVAQGIAAYSYYRYYTLASDTPYEVDTQSLKGYIDKKGLKELYGDMFDVYYDKIEAAATTASQYNLNFQGEPLLSAYHAISNGKTESSENVWGEALPYLTPVSSAYDKSSQGYETAITISSAELKTLLTSAFEGITLSEDDSDWLKILSRTDSGYINEISIGDFVVSGSAFRQVLSARSSDIEISRAGESTFVFTVRGYGHGVGMSQVGAEWMAQNESTFKDILQHYYQGCSVDLIT